MQACIYNSAWLAYANTCTTVIQDDHLLRHIILLANNPRHTEQLAFIKASCCACVHDYAMDAMHKHSTSRMYKHQEHIHKLEAHVAY